MKRPQLRLSVDSLILGAASITLAMSLFFLLQDGYLFSENVASNLTPVGTFNLSGGDVRRRVDAGLTWTNVDAPDKVYEGDSIFTGEGSNASITLDNGNVLKVEPKSLVVVRTRGNKLEIDLQYGSLQGKISGDQPIVITQNGKSQELSGDAGSEVRIVKEEAAQPTRVQVTRGQMKVKSAEAKTAQVVKVNEVVQIADNIEAVVEKSTLSLVAPADGEIVWVPMGKALKFKWTAAGAAAGKSLRLELASDSKFAKKLFTTEVSGTQYNLQDEKRPNGPFYWRIKPQGESASLPGFATAYADLAPMPVLPVDQHVYPLDVDKKEKAKAVFFTWEDQSGSTSFEVQVARDEKFKDIVTKKSGKDKVARVNELAAGTYFWRVMGFHNERKNAPWSRTMSFSIENLSTNPKVPVMAAKEIDYVIPRSVLARTPASVVSKGRGVKPENMTPFAWSKTENASTYEVEVARDASFENSVKNDNGETPSFVPREVRPGSLYLRVRAKSADGRLSPPSEPTKLTVSLPAPVINTIKPVTKTFPTQKDADQAQHEFKFAWTPQSFADSYEMQWGSDSNFTKSKKFRVKEFERSMKVTRSASYALRVRSLASDGSPISPYSDVETVSWTKVVAAPKAKPAPVVAKIAPPVIEAPRLPAAAPAPAPTIADKVVKGVAGLMSTLPIPKLREPLPETALVSLEAAPTFVNFKWASFKGAKSYTIQIAEDADFTKVVAEKQVKKNSYLFEKELPEGKVFWRVRVHTKAGFSEWSDPSDLKVIYQ